MAEGNKDAELIRLTKELINDFARWNYLFRNGGSDPFHSDGCNLNLVRNHIIADKSAIRRIVESEQAELSFFDTAYPDVYHWATPDLVPQDYMVKANEIRQRAREQLDLYESDPNFLYILENHPKVFPKGETKATKEAGLSIWSTCGLTRYRKVVEQDDLVSMRRDFHESYETRAERWAAGARALKAFLEAEHNPKDNIPVPDDYADDEYPEDELNAESAIEEDTFSPSQKHALDVLISDAKARNNDIKKEGKQKEEQMSLF